MAAASTIWARLAPSSTPSARGDPAVATDPLDNTTLVYGGIFGSSVPGVSNETWEYKDGVWTNLTSPSGKNPPALGGAALGYDQKDGYFVLFGGALGFGGSKANQTWTYANGKWTNLTGFLAVAPSVRYSESLTYDPTDGYLMLFGGHGSVPERALSDTWKFAGAGWTNITGQTGGTPAPRGYQTVTFDARLNALVMFGGRDYPGSAVYNDTWTFAHGRWTDASSGYSTAPEERRGAMISFVPLYGYDLLFGGDNPTLDVTYGDTWALTSRGWLNLTNAVGMAPTGRFWGGLWYDATSRSEVLFGGCTATYCPGVDGDTWTYVWNLSATLTPSSTRVDVNTTLTFSTVALGGALNYSYHYSGLPSGCVTANVPALSCTPTAAGSFAPQVVVTDAYVPSVGSATSVSAVSPTVQVFGAFHVALGLSASNLDLGQSVWLNASVTGGSGGYTFIWSGLPVGCSSANVSNLLCYPTAAGSSQPLVTARDSFGRANSVAIVLTIFPPLSVMLRSSSVVATTGQSVVFFADVTGGSGSLSYGWSGLPAGCSGSDSPSLTCSMSSAGSVTVTVVVSDASRTVVRAATTVTVTSSGGAQAGGCSNSSLGCLSSLATLAIGGLVGALGVALTAVVWARRGRRPGNGDSRALPPAGTAPSDSRLQTPPT